MNCRKLEEWDSGDEFGPAPDVQEKSTAANKNSRVVVLKHMFTLKQLDEDASLLLDLKEDVREECSSLGEVTNVVLYDVSMYSTSFPNSDSFVGGTRGDNDGQIPRSYQCSGLRPSECTTYPFARCCLACATENARSILRWTTRRSDPL